MVRLLTAFAWVVKGHMRGTMARKTKKEIVTTRPAKAAAPNGLNHTMNDDAVIRTLLNEDDANYVLWHRKPPVAILFLVRQSMASLASPSSSSLSVLPTLGSTEHRLIEDNLRHLNHAFMIGEKIRSTPIPPVYSAHTARLMMMYLAFLPVALLGGEVGYAGTFGLSMTVGYAVFGLDEMSHMFEQPYKFMPLYQLAKVSMLDAADAICATPEAQRRRQQQQPHNQQEAIIQNEGTRDDVHTFSFEEETVLLDTDPRYWLAAANDPSMPNY